MNISLIFRCKIIKNKKIFFSSIFDFRSKVAWLDTKSFRYIRISRNMWQSEDYIFLVITFFFTFFVSWRIWGMYIYVWSFIKIVPFCHFCDKLITIISDLWCEDVKFMIWPNKLFDWSKHTSISKQKHDTKYGLADFNFHEKSPLFATCPLKNLIFAWRFKSFAKWIFDPLSFGKRKGYRNLRK